LEITQLALDRFQERNSIRSKLQTASLENFDDNVDMNRAWEGIRENINISAKESLGHYELQQCKP
jgi:hypothetical protein